MSGDLSPRCLSPSLTHSLSRRNSIHNYDKAVKPSPKEQKKKKKPTPSDRFATLTADALQIHSKAPRSRHTRHGSIASTVSEVAPSYSQTRTESARGCTPAFFTGATKWPNTEKYMKSSIIYEDIHFEWTIELDQMNCCDHNQLLYVVSIVIDDMNRVIKQSKDDTAILYNKALILCYLHYDHRIDGFAIDPHDSHQFIQNIKHIVFGFDGNNDNDFSAAIHRQRSAHALYQNIHRFKVQSIRMGTQCTISFTPSMNHTPQYDRKELPLHRSVVSIISTLNQYETSTLLHKKSEHIKVMGMLDECKDKISGMLCDNWTHHIKTDPEHAVWSHTIQNINDCTALNTLYVLNCILNHKLDDKFKNVAALEEYTPKILQFFLQRKATPASIENDKRFKTFYVDLNKFIGEVVIGVSKDLTDDLKALRTCISRLSAYRITAFYIQTDVKWDTSVQSLNECKVKDILYIVLYYILHDPSLHNLLPLQDQIVELFVRNNIDGSKFENMNQEKLVDYWKKMVKTVLKTKYKASLMKLHHQIKRCRVCDMADVSLQTDLKWNKRTNFKNIQCVGYRCDDMDDVIVVADIIAFSDENNKNQIQLSVKNIGSKDSSNSYLHLTEPFWLDLPNDRLCKPSKEAIQQSHCDVLDKWMMILEIKHQQNSEFEENIFRDMALLSQIHPQLIFTIKHSNYAMPLKDKTYDHLLKSLLASSLAVRCRRKRCHGSPQLDCHCNANEFQLYTYHMLMAILRAKRKNNNAMLEILKQRSHDSHDTATAFCKFLRIPSEDYMDKYTKHIQNWLLYDFYNSLCLRCGNVNKSIMIDRVFHYSATLQHCRTCGHGEAMNRFETNDIVPTMSLSVDWFCNTRAKKLEEEGIKPQVLKHALNTYNIGNILLGFVESLLNQHYDALTYYLSRFLSEIQILRIEITVDYYFYGKAEQFASVEQLMNDAGLHARHINIFKDCWNRAFPSIKDTRLFHNILVNIDEEKSNTNDDVLCVDVEYFECIRSLKRAPSISAFTTQFIQKLNEYSPIMNRNVPLKELVFRFLDFKIDDGVFPVISDELELLSLLHNKWEHFDTMSHSARNKPSDSSLRREIEIELQDTVSDIKHQYSMLHRKAQNLWTQAKHKRITVKRSNKRGYKRGAPIGVSHIHAVLLFVEIPELRHKIRRLLSAERNAQAILRKRFYYLFGLLSDAVYLYGDVLESMYYSLDKDVLFDKYRARVNIPILGYNSPITFNEKSNQMMAQCQGPRDTPLYCFNITSLVSTQQLETDLYIFCGASDISIQKEIHMHMNRDALGIGSECSTYSRSKREWYDGKVDKISVDDEGEWLHVQYYDGKEWNLKQIQRLSESLSVVKNDSWNDLLQHFSADPHTNYGNNTLIKIMHRSLLSKCKCDVKSHPELRFRIKTVLAYYKLRNVIPDFDLFIKETKLIHLDNIECFRKPYYSAMKTKAWFDVDNNTLNNELCETFDVGIFMRYDVNDPRFESLAEETMFNEVINVSNQRFDEYLMKAKEIHNEKCFIMLSKSEDFNFGIERYEPISIAHITAIIIHTEEPNYAREFTRSYLLLNRIDSNMVIQHHCNNFYWFGRYLFECVEYFGSSLGEQSSARQRQGLSGTYKFDLFAPLIHFPRCTAEKDIIAFRVAGYTGCVLDLGPKYLGILNSTKFIKLSCISEDYDSEMRLFFGRRCAIQIR
eukprot:761820_1